MNIVIPSEEDANSPLVPSVAVLRPHYANEKQLMIDEKIYYRDGEEFHFFDDKGNFNIKGLVNFLIAHDRIELVQPKKDMGSKIKVYFLFNKS